MTGRAIKTTKNAPELRKEIMAPLDRIPNLSHSCLGFAALGSLQAKAGSFGPFLRGTIAVCSIGLRAREGARIRTWDRRLGCKRSDH